MPFGVRVFLVYGFAVLAVLAVSLPRVVAEAVEAPLSAVGVLWMLLLAYVIFTLTLVLQRKQAAYPLSIGLASLSVPLVAILYLSPVGLPGALVALVVSVVIIGSLVRRPVRAWFVEP
jgi:hypothetical protein